MRVSYGPPGHKGVSTLMAVGDDEYASSTDTAVKRGTYVALGALAVGVVFGSRTLRGLGAGGALALILVRAAARPRRQPTTAGG